jgi:hypothetical protein
MVKIFGPKRDELQEAGENCVVRNSVILLFAKCQDDQIKKDEMGAV